MWRFCYLEIILTNTTHGVEMCVVNLSGLYHFIYLQARLSVSNHRNEGLLYKVDQEQQLEVSWY